MTILAPNTKQNAKPLPATILAPLAKKVTKAAKVVTKPAAKSANTPAPADAKKAIKLLAKANPHGEKTKDHAKWKLVAANLTVGATLKAGVDRGYLNYMARRKLIAIG
jgi:hypothetical protein